MTASGPLRLAGEQPRATWVEIPSGCDFPLANLPYGVFSAGSADRPSQPRVGVAIGEYVLDIAALAAAGVTATLLPIAAFYLKLGRFAPARALIDAGVPVALATDVNPGGGFSPSMPFAMTLACFGMGLTFEEALVAATINGACSLDRDASVGSLEPGKLMDAVLIDGDAIDLIRVGAATIAGVIKRGRVVPTPNSQLPIPNSQ